MTKIDLRFEVTQEGRLGRLLGIFSRSGVFSESLLPIDKDTFTEEELSLFRSRATVVSPERGSYFYKLKNSQSGLMENKPVITLTYSRKSIPSYETG